MPPTRRRSGPAAATRSNQATLSFGSKSRVTKPSATPTQTQKTKDLEPIIAAIHEKAPEPEEVSVPTTESSQPHVAELAVRQQAQAEAEQPLTKEDEKAIKITEKDLQVYWQKEEKKRRGPRFHQQDLTLHEKILRHFDLSSQFGPCIGIARSKRWRRANSLNLNPPIEVLAVLLKTDDVKQRAYVDELLS
ncbi:DNA polymerase delta, subunit 4-domain-containing protein [Aspergillus bertholletiae]|uniref:DNA polymerase delta, subunit 4-domain-containing protein n=1 Tax=Aspergillus bertholletiae TaxID=1226010 RepID=A0A5N7B4S5_9EURO|nr:DNA polymerase delta, subunit 4-domain-containing protein [Aspergillus bertholletiae]